MAKRGKFLYFTTILLLLIPLTLAADVAYIYKKEFRIDENIVKAFEDAGLTVDLIKETNIPRSFDNYKLIFVGDEKFTDQSKIPVNKKETIVANYFHAESWGLTDNEGVSLLASSSPLSVRKEGRLIQVYNRALDPSGHAIPYYYLDKENEADALKSVALTETTSSGSKFGDVIAYAEPGSRMANGKIQEKKMCFFGIVESDFWTSGGRTLFNECIGFVASQCNTDSDCSQEIITGEPFCQNGNVYVEETKFKCNKEEVVSQCLPNNNSVLLHECEFGCSNGACLEGVHDVALNDFSNSINKIKIEHANGTDVLDNVIMCNQEYRVVINVGNKGNFSENVTFAGNIGNITFNHLSITNFAPGDDSTKTRTVMINLPEGEYDINVEAVIAEDDFLSNNEAQREVFVSCPSIICNNDNDCDDLNSSTQDRCINPGTPESVCVNEPIRCFTKLDCGTDGFTGENYCSEKNVSRDFREWTCNNPGTAGSSCSSLTEKRTIEICSDLCVNGMCEGIECHNDNDCDDSNPLTSDVCVNPGTIVSECRNTPINCASDNDCGFTGFEGSEFCSGGDVAKNYRNSTCVSAGTKDSRCIVNVEPIVINQCESTCSNGACVNENILCSSDSDCPSDEIITPDFCSTNNVNKIVRTWQCENPGMQTSYCESNIETQLVTSCEDSCLNGQCVEIRCFNNQDCNDNNSSTSDLCVSPGTPQSSCTNNPINIICSSNADCVIGDLEDRNVCFGNDVTRISYQFTCHNPGTSVSSCSSSVTGQLIEQCAFLCSQGVCINDNGMECTPGETKSCGNTNTGLCKLGTRTCNSEGQWGSCVGDINPKTEICDNKDNDCDGNTDEGGVCTPSCTNICNEGARQCSGNGYQICGNFDNDECTEWSDVSQCGNGKTCESGQCVNEPPQCSNDCSDGSRMCSGDGYKICRDYDGDGCTEWSGVAQCGFGKTCDDGMCVNDNPPQCSNQCSDGARQCSGNGYQICRDYNGDGCTEWSGVAQCGFGKLCRSGECINL